MSRSGYMTKPRRYRIWSHEHGAWWLPNGSGYTPELSQAGTYTREQAADITLDVIPPGTEIAVAVGCEDFPIWGKVPC